MPLVPHVWRCYNCAHPTTARRDEIPEGKNAPYTYTPNTPNTPNGAQNPQDANATPKPKWEPSWNQKEAEEPKPTPTPKPVDVPSKENADKLGIAEKEPEAPPIIPVKAAKQIMIEHFQVPALERLIEFRLDPRCRKRDINIYLGGAPGAGKSYAIKHLAKRLRAHNGSIGLEYCFIALSDATMPSAIFGFQQKDGDFVPTPFYHIYKNGGVIDIAELDNTNASVFTQLNNALDNGSYFFPGRNKDEAFHEVTRHPDCIVIGNGNTFLRGPSGMFPGRQRQDAAAIERFKFINWKYDNNLETFLVTHTKAQIDQAVASYAPTPISFPEVNYNAPRIVQWLQTLRDKCTTGDSANPTGYELVVSPRGTYNLFDCLDAGFSLTESLDMCIWKEYEKKSTLLTILPLNI
jgi:hypothetical protein